MQHPSTPGPSRRRSPTSLDPATFGLGAGQSRDSKHDHAHMSDTTASTGVYYLHTTQLQAAYMNDDQTSRSPHYTHADRPSYHNRHAFNNQPYQQAGTSYQSALTEQSQPFYHGPPIQPTAGTSHVSSEKGTKVAKPAATTSRRTKDNNPDMNSKMGRWRLGKDMPAQPSAELFAVGELKRKDRAPSRTETSSAAEALANKKAKPAATADAGMSEDARRSDRADKAKKHRDKLSRDIADLATRLPPHLQLFEDKPTVANIRQAITHIDELENEAAQLRGAHVACEQEILWLRSVQSENEKQIQALRNEKVYHLESLNEKESRIRALEAELQTWRYR